MINRYFIVQHEAYFISPKACSYSNIQMPNFGGPPVFFIIADICFNILIVFRKLIYKVFLKYFYRIIFFFFRQPVCFIFYASDFSASQSSFIYYYTAIYGNILYETISVLGETGKKKKRRYFYKVEDLMKKQVPL